MTKCKIKLLLTDFDGVLTDGSVFYTGEGEFAKRFHIHDGMGILLVHQAGIKTGIITSEKSELVTRRAERLKIDYVYMGKEMGRKLPTIEAHCDQTNITMEEVAYMGDDINCYDLLEQVGYPACPMDAQERIKAISGIHITEKRGGNGALREWINYLFAHDCFAINSVQ